MRARCVRNLHSVVGIKLLVLLCSLQMKPEESVETPSTSAIETLFATDEIRKNVIAPDYLYIGNVGVKGRGIFTRVFIRQDSYVLYYHGKRSYKEPGVKEDMYHFSIKWDTETVWIDASEEDGSYARLMNHDETHPNIRAHTEYHDEPHVCFYAIRDIMPGEELRYAYRGGTNSYI